MELSIEEQLSQSYEGYDISAYRNLFENQLEFDKKTYTLISSEIDFDTGSFNSDFVTFMFLGKNGNYIINELDWDSGIIENHHMGLKLLQSIKDEISFIGPNSSRDQISWRMEKVVENWLPLLTGLYESEEMDFRIFVYDNFEFYAKSYIDALPDYQNTKIKLSCNGNEAVFLFLSICACFEGNDYLEQKKVIEKLEDVFQFKNQTTKEYSNLKYFRRTSDKFKNGALTNVDSLIETIDGLLLARKQKITS